MGGFQAMKVETAPAPIRHIFVLVHGNNGYSDDWSHVEECIRRQFKKESILIIKSKKNEGSLTFKGIRNCAKNLASEILEQTKEPLEEAKRADIKPTFSLISHSLGGLITRCCLPIIFEEEFGSCVEPLTYFSISSPHLGSRRPGGSILNFLWKTAVNLVVNRYQQTGAELLFKDAPKIEDTLLYQMANPELAYMKCLRRFKNLTLASTPYNDISVPFCASSIRKTNPYAAPTKESPAFYTSGHHGFEGEAMMEFLKARIEISKPVAPGLSPLTDEEKTKEFISDDSFTVEFPPKVLENLQTLPFRRIDVQFGYSYGFHVHDLFLRKSKFYYPSMDAGSGFVELLVDILSFDAGIEREVVLLSVADGISDGSNDSSNFLTTVTLQVEEEKLIMAT